MPAKQNIRVGGYAVAIHGFIKVPSNDIQAQIERLKDVDAAIKANDASKLVAMMEIDEDGISQKFVNRLLPKAAEPQLPLTPQTAEPQTAEPQTNPDPRPKSLRAAK